MTYSYQSSVPADLSMNHDLPPKIIHLDHRITPTEIRFQVLEPHRQRRMHYRRVKPCAIY
jgi:hypothetical protein